MPIRPSEIFANLSQVHDKMIPATARGPYDISQRGHHFGRRPKKSPTLASGAFDPTES